jgi:hypothetical protein
MKLARGLLSLLLVVLTGFISFIALPTQHATAQESNTALQRGYRTGYSDGYMAGYRDSLDNQTKDFLRHPDYASADRAYNKDYGPVVDYRDGYKQGFESGYDAGFDKRTFDSTVPAGIARRDSSTQTPSAIAEQPPASQPTPAEQAPIAEATIAPNIALQSNDVITIQKDTELILELRNELSTARSAEGDRFTAMVVSPVELSGAIVEGRVNKIQKPGRIKRRSELSMSFDRIIVSESRWGNFSGVLTEVLPAKGDNVRRVDDEGAAIGKSSIKTDAIKLGASTGTGATIGAVTAGPVGAAVGAGVGAAFGVGAVIIERGKDIRLNVNQQLRVRTSYDTQIR